MPTSSDRNDEFEDGLPDMTAEELARREVVRIAGPCNKNYKRIVTLGGYELEPTEIEGMTTLSVAPEVPFGSGPHSPPLIDVTKPADKMNEFIRQKMREDRFYAQMRPIVPIGNDELDRSVPTNLPVDPTKDNHYQAFRRARGLPDTTEAMEEFCRYARINNGIPGHEKIPDAAIDTISQIAIQARLSEKHTKVPVLPTVPNDLISDDCGHITPGMMEEIRKQFMGGFHVPHYVGTPKSEPNPLEEEWKALTNPALGVPHEARVPTDEEVAAQVNAYTAQKMIDDGGYERIMPPVTVLEETTMYVKRESFVMEFFASETIGATIPHFGSMVKTDDPAFMSAIAEAEKDGRITIDDHGSIQINNVHPGSDPDPDDDDKTDDDPDKTPLLDDDDAAPIIVDMKK